MARFQAPPRAQRVTRFRAPGLGGVAQPIADEENDQLHALETTTPTDGFQGVESRTRFNRPVGQITVGHGAQQTGGYTPQGSPTGRDPGTGLSRFDFPYRFPPDRSELPARVERMATLGTGSTVNNPNLDYERRRIDTTVGPFVLQDPNAMGWGKPPFPRAMRQPRYLLREEFMQDAQSFSGLHTLVIKGGKSSTSPVRMAPPRTNRLTRRDDPGSWGQTTKVMNR